MVLKVVFWPPYTCAWTHTQKALAFTRKCTHACTYIKSCFCRTRLCQRGAKPLTVWGFQRKDKDWNTIVQTNICGIFAVFQTCSRPLNSLSILTQPSVQHAIIVVEAKVGRHRGGTSSVCGGLSSKGTVRGIALVPILYQTPVHQTPIWIPGWSTSTCGLTASRKLA